MDVPFLNVTSGQVGEAEEIEQLARAYLYWTPHRWLALGAEYQFERFDTDPEAPRDEIVEIKTHRLPLKISFFHPLGFSAWMKATHVNQRGEFGNSSDGIVRGDDKFWVVDASIGYRLPKRWGLITLEARNLFDEEFKFQDTDPANPRIYPDRLILGKITLSF
jgi:outer membrane receptor protein involved in Fe transport